jgi:hypothetical protein
MIYYTLPSHWANWFVNGTDWGLSAAEMRAIYSIERELRMTGYNACAYHTGDGVEFIKNHDACHVYPYAAECVKIYFQEA